MTDGFKKYKGRMEYNPGELRFREKGVYNSEKSAREAQEREKLKGSKTKVVHYPGSVHPWSLQVMAKHDFWKNKYTIGK